VLEGVLGEVEFFLELPPVVGADDADLQPGGAKYFAIITRSIAVALLFLAMNATIL